MKKKRIYIFYFGCIKKVTILIQVKKKEDDPQKNVPLSNLKFVVCNFQLAICLWREEKKKFLINRISNNGLKKKYLVEWNRFFKDNENYRIVSVVV